MPSTIEPVARSHTQKVIAAASASIAAENSTSLTVPRPSTCWTAAAT